MNCRICGNEFEGYFCNICGTPSRELEGDFALRVKESFSGPEESLLGILGTDSAKSYFSTGKLGNGFAILSDKRIYFKGRCYVREGKGYSKKTEERIVDLNDVTETRFVHYKSIITTILYYIFFALSCMVIFAWPFWGIYYATRKQWAKKTAWYIQCVFYLMPLFYIIYKMSNYSMFEVSYADSAIALDLSWITKEESDVFQKVLQKVKSEY